MDGRRHRRVHILFPGIATTNKNTYQLPVSMVIFRGRYRKSLSHPAPLESNVPLRYEFALRAGSVTLTFQRPATNLGVAVTAA